MRERVRKISKACGAVLVWAIVLALIGAPAVFMNTIYGYMPLLFLLMLVIASVGTLLWLGGRVEAGSGGADTTCERGKSVDIGLRLTNRSRLACAKAEAVIEISDPFGLRLDTRTVRFAISGKGEVCFRFDVDMPHIGCYRVGLKSVALYDFFGLFRKTLPVSEEISVTVTPRIHPVEEFRLSEDAAAEAHSETRISVVGGSDYTGVRPYSLGDPMKQIHWKLSAHTREYVTKLQESSRQQEFSVILDFAAARPASREQMMDVSDCLIETALSILEEIHLHDNDGALLYCDKARSVVRTAVSGRESDADLVRSFSVITPEPDAGYPDARVILEQESQSSNRGGNVVVVTCRPTPELIQELSVIKRQHRAPALFYIVPAEWSSREIDAARAPLRALDDAGVPYFVLPPAAKGPF